MKGLRRIIDRQKEAIRLKAESIIKSEFSVTERGGELWLTHNDIAFMKIDKHEGVEEVTSMLEDARNTAVEFYRL